MFPMIPHHLTRAGVETATSARALLRVDASVRRRDARVAAAEDIPADVVSREEDVDALTAGAALGAAGALTVGLDKEGKLNCPDAPGGWMRELRLAGDCHSFNLLLHRSQHSRGKILLQVVRPIRAGEELQMWFSEQTLAALVIPFLTPANIQGDKRYVCHQCGRSFETPNPLKVHLALQCDQLGMRQLYDRLSANHSSRLVQPSASSNQILNLTTLVVPSTAFQFELKTSRDESPSTSHEKAVSKTCSRHSAFKPYWKRSLIASGNSNLNKNLLDDNVKAKIQNGDHPSNMSAFSFLTSVEPVRAFKMASPATNELLAPLADTAANYFHHATQMETLVSNLGRSKQGHLCIYCGKVYSRKYGLKIHIRTHTGFKPLQCKHCLRPFGDPSNLNKHVRLHAEGATPYKCGLCGKILVRRRDLDRHIKSRHGPDPASSPESPVG